MKKVSKAMYGKSMMKTGGMVNSKKMQNGGYYTNTTAGEISKPNPSNSAQMDRGVSKPNTPTTPSTPPSSPTPARDIRKMDRYENRLARKSKKYKTGGMVNSNAKVSAIKSAGSKGVKSGVNSKATASKVAKGKVGGTSKAPKTAVPKAQYGGVKKK